MGLMDVRREILMRPPRRKVIWNQFAPPLDANNWRSISATSSTVEFDNGDCTLTVLTAGSSTNRAPVTVGMNFETISGHKYYGSYLVKAGTQIKWSIYGICGKNASSTQTMTFPANAWRHYHCIEQAVGDYTGALAIANPRESQPAGTVNVSRSPIFIDLTLMFGAGKEPTLEEFERLCTLNGINTTKYQPIDAGTEKWWIM